MSNFVKKKKIPQTAKEKRKKIQKTKTRTHGILKINKSVSPF